MGSEVTRSGVGGQLLGSEVRNGGHSAEVTVWGQRSPFGVRGHSSGMAFGVGGHGWRPKVTIWGQRSQCEVRGRGQTWGRSHVTEWGQRSPSGVRGHSGSRGQRLGSEVRGQRSALWATWPRGGPRGVPPLRAATAPGTAPLRAQRPPRWDPQRPTTAPPTPNPTASMGLDLPPQPHPGAPSAPLPHNSPLSPITAPIAAPSDP